MLEAKLRILIRVRSKYKKTLNGKLGVPNFYRIYLWSINIMSVWPTESKSHSRNLTEEKLQQQILEVSMVDHPCTKLYSFV